MTTDATAAAQPDPQPLTAPTPPRRGRPRIHPLPDPTAPPRPRGRPRKDGLPAGSVPQPQPQPRPRPTPAPQVAPAPVTVAPSLTPAITPLDIAITGKSASTSDIQDNTRDISDDNTRENTENVGGDVVVNAEKEPAKSEKIDWGEVIAGREKRLEMAIQAILPGQDTLARTQIAQLVIRVSQGEHWTAASTAVGIVWAQFRVNLSRSAAFRELWHAAEDAGEEWRKADLEAVTWDRARHGWLEPVHYKGKECGHVLKFSDRLAEIHLRASNPARFAPSPGESGGTQAQTIIIHLDAPQVRPAIPTASTEIDAQAIPSGNQPPPDTSKGQ